MTADDFVKIVRKGSDKLRVDDLVLQTGECECQGKGMLIINQDSIKVEMTFDPGQNPPRAGTGIFTRRDCWKLSGLIESHLRFRCDFVGPVGDESWFNGVTKRTFKIRPIELVPSGWDSLSREDRARLLTATQETTPASPGPKEAASKLAANSETEQGTSAYFRAMLVDFEIFARNREPEAPGAKGFQLELSNAHYSAFTGEVGKFDFALLKDERHSDLSVLLKSKEASPAQSEQADWKVFDSLMRALGLAHGIHGWPYRIEYWKDGKKITDRVNTADRLPRTTHAPFTEKLWFDFIVGRANWDFRAAIELATAFFMNESRLTEEVAEILFLFREAGDGGVHGEITTITLCVLFENLVQTIFRELKIMEKATAEDPQLAAFANAKAELAEELRHRIETKDEAYRRLLSIVQSANPFSIGKIFQAVVRRLNLQWEGDMEIVFDTWKRARNRLVHDKRRSEQSEDEIRESMLNESRIAGAINILVLKLVGYSGWMMSSAFEDKYRQI